MEQMMVQNVAPAQGMSFRALQGMLAGQQQMGGDGFAALFQQMVGALGGEGDPMAQLFAQLGQMQQDAEEEGEKLGMQMLAELFASQDPMAQQLAAQFGLSVEQVQELAALEESAGRAAQTQQPVQMQQAGQPVQQDAQTQDGQQAPVVQFFSAEQGARQQEGGASDGQSLMQGEQQFRDAVQIAREKLGGQRQETQPADVDALQAHADNYRFEPVQPMQKLEATVRPDPKEVVSQLRDGILGNLGKEEFVVKLKPEGLGEITVRMTEQEGGVSLRILASSTQVAKLITDQVMALQNALRPLQAQVVEVSALAPQAAEQAAQYGAFSEQQQFHQQPSYHSGQGGGSNTAQAGAEPEESGRQVLAESGLNAYI